MLAANKHGSCGVKRINMASIVFLSALFLGLGMPVAAISEARSSIPISRRFLGETLVYDLGFLWFRRLAEVHIRFRRDPLSEGYRASFKAKTVGLLGWITNYRENIYISYMEEIEDGRRLRPTRFERTVIVGPEVDRSIYEFDYDAGAIFCTVIQNGWINGQFCVDIPPGKTYDDLLTAFYNFRGEAYGPITRGRRQTISALKKWGAGKYTVDTLSAVDVSRKRRDLDWPAGEGYGLKVRVDKELFRLKDGLIWGWLSPEMLPLVGVAENAVGPGDAVARLRKSASYSPGAKAW